MSWSVFTEHLHFFFGAQHILVATATHREDDRPFELLQLKSVAEMKDKGAGSSNVYQLEVLWYRGTQLRSRKEAVL